MNKILNLFIKLSLEAIFIEQSSIKMRSGIEVISRLEKGE
jgi:hypothetical protein